jgi:predicted metalloendopeptidase
MPSLKNTKRQRHHRIKKRYKTLSTRNISQESYRDNFYIWANYKWIKEVPKTLPNELKYIRPLDNFALIQDDMYKNTETMIHDYIKEHGGPTKLEGMARQFHRMYTSLLHLDKEPILCHIENYCKTYDIMVQKNHIWRFLGYINQIEMIKWSCPIVWGVYPDDYDSKKLTPSISSPSLSLYDYRFYLDDEVIKTQMRGVKLNVSSTEQFSGDVIKDTSGSGDDDGPETRTIEYIKYKQQITSAFLKFIDTVFTKCLGPDYEQKHNIKAQDVYDIECELMQNMNNIDIRYDQDYANIYSTSTHPDIQPDKVKIPHTSKHKTSKYNHRNKKDCAQWTSTSKVEEDKNIPAHYSYNIRGSSRIFIDDSIAHTDIDWRELAEHVGYEKEHTPSYYIASQVGYLKTTMCKLKKEWASDRWKSYWFFIYMRQIICFHDEWRNIYLDFNDTLIRGRYTHFPRKFFPIIGLAYTFPKLMNNEFTARYKNEEMISKVREIGATMVECYKKRIERNEWMSPHTKEGALKKLNTIKFYVGETNISANDPTNLDYDPKDAWGNLMKCSIYHTQYIVTHSVIEGDSKKRMLDSDDIDTINWSKIKTNGIQSYIVNAYYTANTNSIYIPTAYMHSLNIQFGRGYEYDLAALGYTLGHELSHALHVNGRTYDYKGNNKNWWSPRDVATYERKINNIRKQYEDISKKYGFVIDGKLSLSENLADITGLAVCEDALNEFHQRINGDLNLIKKSSTVGINIPIPAIPASSSAMMTDQMRRISFQHFYTYYAIQNRAIANRREILVQVLTNSHLDLKIRTNVPLIRSKIFHDVFEIRKSDKMHHGKYQHDVVF